MEKFNIIFIKFQSSEYDFILTENGQIKLNEFNSASPGAIITSGLLNRVTRKSLLATMDGLQFAPQSIEASDCFASIIERIEQDAGIDPATIAVLYDDHYMLFELVEQCRKPHSPWNTGTLHHR